MFYFDEGCWNSSVLLDQLDLLSGFLLVPHHLVVFFTIVARIQIGLLVVVAHSTVVRRKMVRLSKKVRDGDYLKCNISRRSSPQIFIAMLHFTVKPYLD